MPIIEFEDKKPKIHPTAYVAPSATILGDVTLGAESSVWPGAVLRGDFNKIVVGSRTSIQDNSVIHVSEDFGTYIGDYVTVGHAATVESCVIGNHVMIGMGAIILERAAIEDWVIIAAGAVVAEETHVSSNSLAAGVPAKIKKTLDEHHLERIKHASEAYSNMVCRYAALRKL